MPEVTAIPTTDKKEYAPHKTTSVSTIISQNAAPPLLKKLKKESSVSTNNDNLVPVPSIQVTAGYYDNIVPPPSTQVPPGSWMTAAQEVKAFLSMVAFWAGSQPNQWEMSESVMTNTLQDIFDVVYPGIKYKVNPNGAVFAVTQQQFLKWRSNIGSVALAIIQLLTRYAFIYDDLNNISWEMAYLLAFILQLMVTNHLAAIADHTDVPTLNTHELALGKGMDGTIMLCIVTLKCALKFVQDNIIKVKYVLSSIQNVYKKHPGSCPRH
ncbi:hypothetical protein BDR04DRAFT_1155502 [Suillus decipiens]|nr:hypothetical protein BDR04DRAFT_1155502 [Suillus decipiens]